MDNWPQTLQSTANESEKNWYVTLLLSLFTGFMGGDRLYAGSPMLAALKLCTAGGLACWWLADIALLVFGRMKDGHGLYIKRPF